MLLGEVNTAGDAITLEDGIEAGILTISTFAVTLLANKVIRYNTPTTEPYVVKLVDVNEAPTFDVAGADPINVKEYDEITLEPKNEVLITEAMLGLKDVDAADQVEVTDKETGVKPLIESRDIKLKVTESVNGKFYKNGVETTRFYPW